MSKSHAEFLTKRDEDDLRSILKTTYGRRFISRLLLSCGVTVTGVNFENSNMTYFNAGMRSIGNAMLNEVLRLNPDAYTDMRRMDKEDEDARRLDAEQHHNDD